MKNMYRMAACVAVMLAGMLQTANAGILVYDAQGLSNQTQVKGTAAGLDVKLNLNSPTPNYQAPFNLVNGNPASGPTVVFGTLSLAGTAASMAGVVGFTIKDGTDTITGTLTVAASVIQVGNAEFLNIAGNITNLNESNPAGATYDWSGINFATISITKTGTALSKSVGNAAASAIKTNGSFEFVAAVPEPSSFALLGLGGIGMGIAAIRRRMIAA